MFPLDKNKKFLSMPANENTPQPETFLSLIFLIISPCLMLGIVLWTLFFGLVCSLLIAIYAICSIIGPGTWNSPTAFRISRVVPVPPVSTVRPNAVSNPPVRRN